MSMTLCSQPNNVLWLIHNLYEVFYCRATDKASLATLNHTFTIPRYVWELNSLLQLFQTAVRGQAGLWSHLDALVEKNMLSNSIHCCQNSFPYTCRIQSSWPLKTEWRSQLIMDLMHHCSYWVKLEVFQNDLEIQGMTWFSLYFGKFPWLLWGSPTSWRHRGQMVPLKAERTMFTMNRTWGSVNEGLFQGTHCFINCAKYFVDF